MSANGTKNCEIKKRIFCCEGHLASGSAVMSKYFFRNQHWGASVSILGKAELGCYGTVRNNNNHNETNTTAAVNLSDNTPITYLLNNSLASCNLQNIFRRFVPHIICNNNQFSTPEKDDAHRHSLQSFALILL